MTQPRFTWGELRDMATLNEKLNEKLNDPEFCRALLDDLRQMIKKNERMRKSLRRIETVSGSDGWKDDIIKICNKAAKEGLK